MTRSRTTSRMNQYESLCLVSIRDPQTRCEPSDGKRRGLEKRPTWEFRAGIERLDERRVSVVPRNMRISEFDRAIDEPIGELARSVSAESVANRRTGQTCQESALEKPVKIQHQIEATPAEYLLKGSFTIGINNGKSWAHPVVADGRLYLRDQGELLCYDVRK